MSETMNKTDETFNQITANLGTLVMVSSQDQVTENAPAGAEHFLQLPEGFDLSPAVDNSIVSD